MASEIDFSGKVALVTGGANGIGASAAQAFGAAGAAVAVADITEVSAEVIDSVRSSGAQAMSINCDVGDPNDCQAMVDTVVEKYGRLDYVFNNAGIGGVSTPLHEMELSDWDDVIRINLSGVFYCLKYEIPALLESGGGAIINTSSICGVRPVQDFGHYVAAKHGIVGLTRQVALEYGRQGVRCNAVGPGFIDTAMTQHTMQTNPAALEGLKAAIPMGRIGQPEDIGKVARSLCSDDFSYLNGAYIEVDGGMLLV